MVLPCAIAEVELSVLLSVVSSGCTACAGYEEKQRELEFDLRREEDRLNAMQDEQARLKTGRVN